MNNKGKAGALILIVLLIISFSLAGGIFYLLQNEKSKNAALQTELDNLNAKLENNKKLFEEAKTKIAGLNLELNETQTRLVSVSKELQEEKAAKKDAQERADKLEADLDQLKSERADLEAKVTQAQDVTNKLRDRIKEIASEKAKIELKLRELESKTQGVELGKIVVNPEGASIATDGTSPSMQPQASGASALKPAQAKEGKVLVVNKDYNFVVINLGSRDAVDIGEVFSVFHNSKNVGDVKIEKVHDSMSAAGFSSSDMKDKVAEGDKVIQKVK